MPFCYNRALTPPVNCVMNLPVTVVGTHSIAKLLLALPLS